MNNGLDKLLESGLLNEENKAALEEAWNAKLDEARDALREEVEAQVREELATRIEEDKAWVVASMDKMLSEAVTKYATESALATKALNEERANLTQAIKESRAEYKAKLASNLRVFDQFFMERMAEELNEFQIDRRALEEARVALAAEKVSFKESQEAVYAEKFALIEETVNNLLATEVGALNEERSNLEAYKARIVENARIHRQKMNETTASRVNQLENFVMEKLKSEIQEFNEEKNALVEARVKLISESKAKLEETKKAFINRASKVVEETVETRLTSELTQMKEDIQEARNNLFGRRIFEAFQREYSTSYLSEGSELRKMEARLMEAQTKLDEQNRVLVESAAKLESANRKVQLTEAKLARDKKMSELLTPLSREKKAVMEELLEKTQTSRLDEAFQRYLPTVLTGGMRSATQGRRVLKEDAEPKKTVAKTGDRVTQLAESARAEEVPATDEKIAIAELRRLAGIENKE